MTAPGGQDAGDRLGVDIARLTPGGDAVDFEGEADVVDLDEEFVRPFGGARYRLKAQLFGTELLVRGSLEQDFDLACCRCGRDFDTTVRVDDFTFSAEVGENQQEVDLTADARESIILTLPTYPVCDEACPGIENKAAAEPPFDDRWGALDALKVEGKKEES